MSNNTLKDAKVMFRHACSFADCAKFCMSDRNDLIVRTQWYTIPGIVNSAFACEVFIKSLLIFHGMTVQQIKTHSHGLQGLWNTYATKDQNTATQIRQAVRYYFSSNDVTLFDRKLKEASNAFVDWRYWYEGNHAQINLHFLMAFREILRGICCQHFYGITWEDFVESKIKWDS